LDTGRRKSLFRLRAQSGTLPSTRLRTIAEDLKKNFGDRPFWERVSARRR
jgi:hypothetical protein